MKSIFHSASSRGEANHGWLKAKHSFSFANFYNPERIQFGVLRVLNDDIIAPGMGFGTHPHDNMEIITIPLEGALEHKDSMDNIGFVETDEIQVMSAGTGVYHSEYNKNKDQSVSLLQIWVFPHTQNVKPRYGQKNIKNLKKTNSFYPIVTPNPKDSEMWIHQDAWFHLGEFNEETTVKYGIQKNGNGVYVFVIEGEGSVLDKTLSKRDALGIWEADSFSITAKKNSKILLLEVPMQQ
jgi:redox-sensitive bicupin YhaK (pirin superfamily)